MLDRFLATASRGVIATVFIGGGILFMILSDPPKNVCDAQIEVFKNNQVGVIFKDPKRKIVKSTQINRLLDRCKFSNAPGGCYELFSKIKILLSDLDDVPDECIGRASNITEVKKGLWDFSELLAKVAWGETPPETYYQKFGWLDTADISLYCQLKKKMNLYYGKKAWENFREKLFKELPGADGITRKQAWEFMILSTNCAKY